MSLNNKIIPAEDSSLYQLSYNKVIGGPSGCSIQVNGVNVNVAPNSSFNVKIKNVSGGTGCYLTGNGLNIYGDKSFQYAKNTFVSMWDTTKVTIGSSNNNQIKLPLVSDGIYNFIVDWGDGTSNKITTWNQSETTHTYTNNNIYKIVITGTLNGFRFVNSGDRNKLISVIKWGNGFKLGLNGQYFYGCNNLNLVNVEDILDLSGVVDFTNTFWGCTTLTTVNNMNEWDVSNITKFDSTFKECPFFNQDISKWDIKNVTTTSSMFSNIAPVVGNFNQDIGNWNTSNIVSMQSMFFGQAYFNQDISTKIVTTNGLSYTAWDTSNVTTMFAMFNLNSNVTKFGEFNQNIGNWNTSKVTTMQNMFTNQPKFNQNINTKIVTVGNSSYTAWNIGNSTVLSNMFYCSLLGGTFNQNIGNWDTTKVTTIQNMFFGQPYFNQNINTKVVTVSGSSYTAWNVGNVINMSAAFNLNSTVTKSGEFNQNIGNWNTTKVTTMQNMFNNQILFNQDIGTKLITVGGSSYTAWNVENVTTFASFLSSNKGGVFNNNNSPSINDWDTRKVISMGGLFSKQFSFNQPINNWNVSGVTSFTTGSLTGFMGSKTFNDYSANNFDSLIISWSSRSVKPNLPINFGTIKYTTAAIGGLSILTSAPNNWVVTSGGLIY